MSKRWSFALFTMTFFLIFVVFQFESESRKRVRQLDSRVMAMELQIQTLTKTIANQSNANNLVELQRTQDALIQEFRTNRVRVTELLELLIAKDESFQQELNAYKKRDGFRVDSPPSSKESTSTSATKSEGKATVPGLPLIR